MTIELSQEQQQFIQNEIASGNYQSEAALLEEAVDLLRQQKAWIKKVQAGVEQGRQDIAEGRYFEVSSPEDALKLREEIKRRAQNLRAQREHTAH